MRIAMVSEHANPLAALGDIHAGGQNLHVAELSAALRRKGHEVTVYTRRDDPFALDRLRTPAGYQVVHVPAGPPAALPADQLRSSLDEFAWWLRDEWAADPPEVVHAHYWRSGLAGLEAATALSVPVVQTFHSLGIVEHRHLEPTDDGGAERIRLERDIGNAASKVAATSSDEAFELAWLGVPRSRITVVPRGVDTDRFTPEGPHAPKYRRHRLVAAGRPVPHKGFDIAVAALRELPDAELVIAGGPRNGDIAQGEYTVRLRDFAERLGVGDRVWTPGQFSRDDMPTLLRSADAVVCTPWYEPFGLLPLEAMACGTPVIASGVGGHADTVIGGVTGELVPARSPGAVANAARAVLANRATRDAYGVAGRQRAHPRYSWNRIADDTVRVYRRVLGSRTASARKEAT